MKKIIISLLIIIGILITGLLLKDVTIQESCASNDRFVRVYSQNGNDELKIYYDKKTKVMYLVVNMCNKGGGITVLVDANGKPLLYGEE